MTSLGFILGGAVKGASTQLAEHLRRVKSINLPIAENPAFESPHYESGAVARIRESISQLPADVVAGLKRPNYLGYMPAAGRIASEFPHTVMIFALRHPTDRAVSAYIHYCQYGRVPYMPVPEAMARLLDGDDLSSIRSQEILSWSNYAQHLQRFREHFPDKQILVVGSEQIRDSPHAVVRRITETLGVDCILREAPPAESNVGATSVPELMARRAMHRCINTYDDKTQVLIGRTRNPVRLGAGVVAQQSARLLHRHTSKKSKALMLDDETRARLNAHFAADVMYVQDEFGVTL